MQKKYDSLLQTADKYHVSSPMLLNPWMILLSFFDYYSRWQQQPFSSPYSVPGVGGGVWGTQPQHPQAYPHLRFTRDQHWEPEHNTSFVVCWLLLHIFLFLLSIQPVIFSKAGTVSDCLDTQDLLQWDIDFWWGLHLLTVLQMISANFKRATFQHRGSAVIWTFGLYCKDK